MKHKLLEFLKKYKFAILIATIIIVLGLIITILIVGNDNKLTLIELKSDNYIVKYDSSWKITSQNEKQLVLEHKSDSEISIELVDLQSEYQYSDLDDIIDNLLYDIEKQNKEFKMIYKEKSKITKNEYDGYKILYEKEDSQAMLNIAKKNEKIILITYEAKNDYFDILLDSVHNVIYNFDVVEKKHDLKHEIKVETSSLSYTESEDVVDSIDESVQKEIAANNYFVKFSIPKNFQEVAINSYYGSYRYDGLKKGNINLSVNVYNKNIYEHLDKDKTVNIYSSYKYYKNSEEYSDFIETLSEYESEYQSYIYKCSYYNEKMTFDDDGNKKYVKQVNDNIIIVYALDKNHILEVKLESSGIAIPKEMVDNFKIESIENYSSFIKSTKENGQIKSELKRYINYDKTIERILLLIPEKYKEIDKKYNVYSQRNYVYEYNNKIDEYIYEVEYSITNSYTSIESQVGLIDNSMPTSYGPYNKLLKTEEKIINNKKFVIYDGGYTEISGIMFTSIDRYKYYVNTKVLFYELPGGGYLIIRIDGKHYPITDEMINELTNFEI